MSDTAPDFRLQNQDEKWVSLSELLTKGPVMVVFYPGDFTPVCTKQLCAYQDALDRFSKHGVQVVGISPQDGESHRKFRARYGFSFDLLTDKDKAVTRAYGVTSLFMFGGTSRAVFIVAPDKKILFQHVEPTVLTHRKPQELLEAMDRLFAR